MTELRKQYGERFEFKPMSNSARGLFGCIIIDRQSRKRRQVIASKRRLLPGFLADHCLEALTWT